MAIAHISTEHFEEGGSGAQAQSLTIPAATDFMIVSFVWYTGSFSGVNLNGTDSFTEVASVTSGSASGYVSIWRLIAPDTGAQTLNYTAPSATEGIQVIVAYFSGVDQSTPIRDSDIGDRPAANDSVSNTPTIDSSDTDLGYGVGYSYQQDGDMDRNSQTELNQYAVFNDAVAAHATQAGSSGGITLEIYGDYPLVIGVSMQAAAGQSRQFASVAAIATSTPNAGLAVQRRLASSASPQTSTPAAILAVQRQLQSHAAIQTLTSDILAAIRRTLASNSTIQSTTSAAMLAIRRELASAVDARVYGSELITNGNMELDSDWNPVGGAPVSERSDEQSHGGSFSWKFSVNSLGQGVKQADIPYEEGKYKLSFWVYPVENTSVRVRMFPILPSNLKTFTGLIPGQWNRCEWERTVSSGTGSDDLIFQTATDTSGTWYIDDVSLKEIISDASLTSTSDVDMIVRRILATLAAVQTLTSDINLDLGTGVKQFASTAAVQTATAAILLAVQRPFASIAGIQTLSQDALLAIRRTLASSALAQTLTSDIDLTTAIQFASIASVVTSTSDVGVDVRRLIASLAATQTDTGAALVAILRQLASQADAATVTAAIDLLLGVIGEIINPSSVSITPVRTLTGINIKTSASKTPIRTIEPA